MTPRPDRLYDLLPTHIRQRDVQQGDPLRALLQVISTEVNRVEGDLDQLYENWFIETCQPWVVPYLGDLVGEDMPSEPGFLLPRRSVGRALRHRRRKGTLAVLEELAEDTGWSARAVEFFRLLGWTQSLNHLHQERGGTVNLREGLTLERINGPFDTTAHTVDVRRIKSHRTLGTFNIPSVGLHLFRLGAYSVTRCPARCVETEGNHCFTFSELGQDAPLFTHPDPDPDPGHLADPLKVPVPISRRELECRKDGLSRVSPAYYGEGRSLLVWAKDWPRKGAPQPIPIEALRTGDLTDWGCRPARDTVAIDPVLGRLIFPPSQPPSQGVLVSYLYGFPGDLGGGEYVRPIQQPEGAKVYRMGRDLPVKTVADALAAWTADRGEGPASAVIELADSGVYTEPLRLQLRPGDYLQIRAAQRTRPILRLLDYAPDQPDAFSLRGGKGSRFVLDGVMVQGRGLVIQGPDVNEGGPPVRVASSASPLVLSHAVSGPSPNTASDAESSDPSDDLCQVEIRHCTLVPGWNIDHDCRPKHPHEASLAILNSRARLKVIRSILGPVRVEVSQTRQEPNEVDFFESILDGMDLDNPVLHGGPLPFAHVRATFRACTALGQVLVHALTLGENSLFLGAIQVARRQIGCLRYSYVAPGSRAPRRTRCQPETAIREAQAPLYTAAASHMPPGLPASADLARAKAEQELRLRPQILNTAYGTPGFGQLALPCPDELFRGADDGGSMGAFHFLNEPQRMEMLQRRLDAFTPAGLEAGLLIES